MSENLRHLSLQIDEAQTLAKGLLVQLDAARELLRSLPPTKESRDAHEALSHALQHVWESVFWTNITREHLGPRVEREREKS